MAWNPETRSIEHEIEYEAQEEIGGRYDPDLACFDYVLFESSVVIVVFVLSVGKFLNSFLIAFLPSPDQGNQMFNSCPIFLSIAFL